MIYKIDKKRPLSWSAISSFEYDPEQWYKRYVLKEDTPPNSAMSFGKVMGERFAAETTFLPQLPRASVYEYELKAKLGKIPLIGFIDSYTPHTNLEEYKTGVKAWDQKRADSHGQLDMYLLLLYLMHKVPPEQVSCRIHWLPTRETGDFKTEFSNPDNPLVHTFHTKRTMRDILEFGQRINRVYKEMESYAHTHE